MHDGSIATLRDVIEHYARGGRLIESGPYAGDGRLNPNKSGLLIGFVPSEYEIQAVLAFLESLTDVSLLTSPELSDPFSVPIHRGDPNASGTTDIADVVTILGHLFLGNPATLGCRESADVDNDGAIEIADVIHLLGWLFTGGPGPAAPGSVAGACGPDADAPGSPGDLGCADYAPCR